MSIQPSSVCFSFVSADGYKQEFRSPGTIIPEPKGKWERLVLSPKGKIVLREEMEMGEVLAHVIHLMGNFVGASTKAVEATRELASEVLRGRV